MRTTFAAFFITLNVLFMPAVSFAASLETGPGVPTPIETTGAVTNPDNCGVNTLCNPLGVSTVCGLIKVLLDAVLVIGIPIAVLFIIYAGFKFVVAQGSPTELGEARKNFFNVIIGIAIFVGASLIAQVIVNTMAALGVQGISSCI